MPDPNKGKKVKGETTTTTSTRRGKQDGKFGKILNTCHIRVTRHR